jgi:hypothetical protein
VITLALAAASAWAGPWVHDPGSWYAKIYSAGFSGGNAYELDTTSLGLYTEVGVLKGLQVQVEVPYVWSKSGLEDASFKYATDGVGPLRAGIGVRPPGVKIPVSLSVFGRFPMSSQVTALPLLPQLGEPQVDVEVVGAGGGSAPLGTQRMWGSAEVGWRHRTEWTPWPDTEAVDGDEMLYRGQLGLLPVARGRQLGWVELHLAGAAGHQLRSLHQWGGSIAIAITKGLHAEIGGDHTYAGGPATITGFGWNAGISHVR